MSQSPRRALRTVRLPLPAPWLLTLALLLLAPPPAQAGNEDGTDARVADRVLKLAGGGSWRGPSRRVDGAWERRDDQGWRPLPPHWVVVSAEDEDDLLREASSRRARARRGSLDERAEVAAWMLEQGLLTEAFRQLDDVLEEAPDHLATRELLRAQSMRIALPAPAPAEADEATRRAALEHLLVRAGEMPPTLRELVVAGLEDEARGAHGDALRDTLVEALRSPRPGRRAFAALALRRLYPSRPDLELLRRTLVDPDAHVRLQAGLAVRDTGDPEWVGACIESLGHGSSTVRTHAAEALGAMLEPAAVAPLVAHYAALSEAGRSGGGGGGARAMAFFGTQRAFVQGYNAQVANQAAIADPLVGTVQEGASLDARVLAAGGGPGLSVERDAVRGALQRITGARPGRNAQAWQKWWQRHGDEWTAKLPAPPAPAEPTGEAW